MEVIWDDENMKTSQQQRKQKDEVSVATTVTVASSDTSCGGDGNDGNDETTKKQNVRETLSFEFEFDFEFEIVSSLGVAVVAFLFISTTRLKVARNALKEMYSFFFIPPEKVTMNDSTAPNDATTTCVSSCILFFLRLISPEDQQRVRDGLTPAVAPPEGVSLEPLPSRSSSFEVSEGVPLEPLPSRSTSFEVSEGVPPEPLPSRSTSLEDISGGGSPRFESSNAVA